MGVDTSPAFILLFRAFSARQQCKIARRSPPARRERICPSASREARFFMRTCDDVGLALRARSAEGIHALLARVCTYTCKCTRARAHIGAIISPTSYLLRRALLQLSALHAACLSAGRDHVSMVSMLSMVFNGASERARTHRRLFNPLQIIARNCENQRSTEHSREIQQAIMRSYGSDPLDLLPV